MKSAMVLWLYSAEQYASAIPLNEIAEHAAQNGFNDAAMDVLCLHGHEFIPAEDIARLRERNFILHDASALYASIRARFPRLRTLYPNHFYECFLRWIVLQEYYHGAPLLAWDADIFFNEKLSRLHAAFAGSTFTSSSTCFVALDHPAWLRIYAEHLDRFEADPEAYLARVFADLVALQRTKPDSFATSFFGPRIAESLHAFAAWRECFNNSPEEMFVDHLVRIAVLPHAVSPAAGEYVLCPQPLLLPVLSWHHPMGDGLAGACSAAATSDAGLRKREHRYAFNGRPLAFIHFQGAVFRACAVHHIFNRVLGRPTRIYDALYCPPAQQAGQSIGQIFCERRPEIEKQLSGVRTAVHPRDWREPFSERAMARLFLIESDLVEVFGHYCAGLASSDPNSGRTTSPARPAPNLVFPTAPEIPPLVNSHLTVCGVGRTLVLGPGAGAIVRRFLSQGIDAWGIDPAPAAGEVFPDERCLPGDVDALPLERGPFASALIIGWDALSDAMVRQLGQRLGAAGVAALHLRVPAVRSFDGARRPRGWWEELFLGVGFRKHPLRCTVLPRDRMGEDDAVLEIYFERVSDPGRTYDSAQSLAPGQIDASRQVGVEADALLARYEVAAGLVRPWDTVLDLACGDGAGTYLLRRATRAGRCVGAYPDATFVDYARAHFGSDTVEFRCQNPAEVLLELPETSIDFALLAAGLEDVDSVDGLLNGMERVLCPGGRLMFALTPGSPVTQGSQLDALLSGRFLLEALHRQSAATNGPLAAALHKCSPTQQRELDPAHAWIVVAMKNPVTSTPPQYRESVFQHVASSGHISLRYAEFYRNPWILHSLVHAGYRSDEPTVLISAAARIMREAPAESADRGAALCLLIYRMIEGSLYPHRDQLDVVAQSEGYLAIRDANPHQLRWQISLAYALGLLRMQKGDFAAARGYFETCASMDALAFSTHLATKTADALFWSGWLAFCADDTPGAESAWTRAVRFGERLLQRPLAETLMNPAWPNLFDYGDGMRELTHALESVSKCANGLHGLRLQASGIPVRWDLIPNSFRFQQERLTQDLRLAQSRVEELCRQVTDARAMLADRTRELDHERALLRERTAELDCERAQLRERTGELDYERAQLRERGRELDAARGSEQTWINLARTLQAQLAPQAAAPAPSVPMYAFR